MGWFWGGSGIILGFSTVDVMYSASNKDNTAPGASGEVQDHQEHHQDDQEQLLDDFKEGFKRFKGGLRGLIRCCFSCF